MQSIVYPVVKDLLEGPAGPIVSFVWGLAEALVWPIIPDYLSVAVAPASPGQWWRIAGSLTAGSVAGGIIGYWFAHLRGTPMGIDQLPLVTPGMVDQARGWLGDLGGLGVLRQPLSGVPYKVFVYLSGEGKISFPVFLWASIAARGLRIFATTGIAAALSKLAGPARVDKFYDIFLVVFTLVFAYGLYRVVASKK